MNQALRNVCHVCDLLQSLTLAPWGGAVLHLSGLGLQLMAWPTVCSRVVIQAHFGWLRNQTNCSGVSLLFLKSSTPVFLYDRPSLFCTCQAAGVNTAINFGSSTLDKATCVHLSSEDIKTNHPWNPLKRHHAGDWLPVPHTAAPRFPSSVHEPASPAASSAPAEGLAVCREQVQNHSRCSTTPELRETPGTWDPAIPPRNRVFLPVSHLSLPSGLQLSEQSSLQNLFQHMFSPLVSIFGPRWHTRIGVSHNFATPLCSSLTKGNSAWRSYHIIS